jgi:hypothetical protein
MKVAMTDFPLPGGAFNHSTRGVNVISSSQLRKKFLRIQLQISSVHLSRAKFESVSGVSDKEKYLAKSGDEVLMTRTASLSPTPVLSSTGTSVTVETCFEDRDFAL